MCAGLMLNRTGYLYPWQTDGASHSLSWLSTSGQSCPPLAGDWMIIRFLYCFFLVLPPERRHKKTQTHTYIYNIFIYIYIYILYLILYLINWQQSKNCCGLLFSSIWKGTWKREVFLCAIGCISLNLSMYKWCNEAQLALIFIVYIIYNLITGRNRNRASDRSSAQNGGLRRSRPVRACQ